MQAYNIMISYLLNLRSELQCNYAWVQVLMQIKILLVKGILAMGQIVIYTLAAYLTNIQ